jgi:hypothetical protein
VTRALDTEPMSLAEARSIAHSCALYVRAGFDRHFEGDAYNRDRYIRALAVLAVLPAPTAMGEMPLVVALLSTAILERGPAIAAAIAECNQLADDARAATRVVDVIPKDVLVDDAHRKMDAAWDAARKAAELIIDCMRGGVL